MAGKERVDDDGQRIKSMPVIARPIRRIASTEQQGLRPRQLSSGPATTSKDDLRDIVMLGKSVPARAPIRDPRSQSPQPRLPTIDALSSHDEAERALLEPLIELLRKLHEDKVPPEGSVRAALESLVPDEWWTLPNVAGHLCRPKTALISTPAGSDCSIDGLTDSELVSLADLPLESAWAEIQGRAGAPGDDAPASAFRTLLASRPVDSGATDVMMILLRGGVELIGREEAASACFSDTAPSGCTALHLACTGQQRSIPSSEDTEPTLCTETAPVDALVFLLDLLVACSHVPLAPPSADDGECCHVLFRCDYSGRTPLMLLAEAGAAHAIDALLLRLHPIRAVPMIDAANDEGKTALGIAFEKKHIQAVHVLLRYGARASTGHAQLPRPQATLPAMLQSFFDQSTNKEALQIRTFRLLAAINSSRWRFKWWRDFVPFSEAQDCFWCNAQLRSSHEMVHCFVCGFVSCELCATSLTGFLRLDGPFAHKTYCKHCKLALLHSTASVNLSPGTNPFTSFYSMPSFLLTESFFFRSAEARNFSPCSSAVKDDLIWVHYLPLAAVDDTGVELPDVPWSPEALSAYFCIRSLRKEALPFVRAIVFPDSGSAVGTIQGFSSWTVDDLLHARDTLHRSLLFTLYVLLLKRSLPEEDAFNIRTCFSFVAHAIRKLHEKLSVRFQDERKFVSQAVEEARSLVSTELANRPEIELMWGERMQRWKVGLMNLLNDLESETSKLRIPTEDAGTRAKRVLKYLKLEKQVKSLLVETSQLDKWTSEFPELRFLRNQLEPLRARAAHILLTPPVPAVAQKTGHGLDPRPPPGLGGGQFKRLQEQMQSWSMEVQVLIAAVDKWERSPAEKRGEPEAALSGILHQLEMLESRTTHMLVYCSEVPRLQPLGSHLNDLYLIVLHHLTRVRTLVGAASSSFALASVLEQEVLKVEMGVLQLRQACVHISPEDMFSENDSVSQLFRKVVKLRKKATQVSTSMLDSFGTGQVVPSQVVDHYRLRLNFCEQQLEQLETRLLNQFGVIIRSNPLSAGLVTEPLIEKKKGPSLVEKAQQHLVDRQLQAAKEEHEFVETQMYDL